MPDIELYNGTYTGAEIDSTITEVTNARGGETSDLPTLGGDFCGTKVLPGSIMQIVTADEPTYLTLDADGTWYPEQS